MQSVLENRKEWRLNLEPLRKSWWRKKEDDDTIKISILNRLMSCFNANLLKLIVCLLAVESKFHLTFDIPKTAHDHSNGICIVPVQLRIAKRVCIKRTKPAELTKIKNRSQ